MSARAFFGLCLRPALAATIGILAALTAGIMTMQHLIGEAAPNAAAIFQIAYNALCAVIVISLGSFAGKVTAELNAIRVAKTIPGLRRKMRGSVVLLVPIVAALALAFIAWAVPGQFHGVSPAAQASLNGFLFCLGLGLGWSRLLPVAVLLLASQHGFVAARLRETPVFFSAVALAAAAALVAIWHARFLRPAGTRFDFRAWFVWLKTDAPDALARRTGEQWREGADWNDNETPNASPLPLRRLLRAGLHERLGHRFGGLAAMVARPIAGAYGLFALLLVVLAIKSPGGDLRQFCLEVFTGAAPRDQWVAIVRVAFAAITGMAAYVAAVTLDTALLPNLWHPVSRRLQARVVFWSRVRQNAAFAMTHLVVALAIVATCAALAGKWPDVAALRAFLAPALACFLLAPVPQALFPHGVETFHAKTSPLIQLGAGLLGGGFCLGVVYWTAHWPTTTLQAKISLGAQAAGFVAAAIAIYAAYAAVVTWHYARVDLTRRVVG